MIKTDKQKKETINFLFWHQSITQNKKQCYHNGDTYFERKSNSYHTRQTKYIKSQNQLIVLNQTPATSPFTLQK